MEENRFAPASRSLSGAFFWRLLFGTGRGSLQRGFEPILEGLSGGEKDASRGGRPGKKASPRNRDNYIKTNAGIKVGWERDGAGGYLVHIKGDLHADTVASLVADIKYSLSKPGK